MRLWEHKDFTKPYFCFLLVWPSIFSILLYFFPWCSHITNSMLQPTDKWDECLKTLIGRMVRNQCHRDAEQRVRQVTRGQTEGYAFRPLRKDLAEWQMTDRDEWYVVFSGQMPRTHATHPSQVSLIDLGVTWSTTWFRGTVEHTRAYTQSSSISLSRLRLT